MAFELIPFPISIIFIVVFAVVAIIALWKLRKKGKSYCYLSDLSLIAGIMLLVLIVYVFATGLLSAPSTSTYSPTPVAVPPQ